MKYYTKEWQKRVSDAPDNARTLADEARTGYRAEQSKNPVPEEFERKLEFHDAQITSAANKMTPFFNIFLDDTFQSSHWGTEIYYGG